MLSNWQRMQVLKKNIVRVSFEHLNPRVQEDINRLKRYRTARLLWEVPGIASAAISVGLRAREGYYSPTHVPLNVLTGLSLMERTRLARLIQKHHDTIRINMKQGGILQTRFENEYPQDWISPAVVGQTHPVFSVQKNGDIIFRKVTPSEFRLLQRQEGLIGKAGLNIWRWRATLRKPTAPETEQKRFLERIKALTQRLRPAPAKKPAFGFARKTLSKPIRRIRR